MRDGLASSDTSVWSPVDLLDSFSRIPAEQLLYASDFPYGQQPSSLTNTIRAALKAGFDEEQLRDLLGRTARRIADGGPPIEPTTPIGGRTFEQPMTFARMHSYLSMATPLLWTSQADTIGVLGLALNACGERDGYEAERARIAELLDCARDLWRTSVESETEEERRRCRGSPSGSSTSRTSRRSPRVPELRVNGHAHPIGLAGLRSLAEVLRRIWG